MTVAVPFPVYPAVGGGQMRVYHLYRHLARSFDIDLVTFAADDNHHFSEEIAPGLREIRIPRSPEHRHAEVQLNSQCAWIGIGDIAMTMLYRLSPQYVDALRKSAAQADCLVASHPYLFYALDCVSDKPIWYDAHNVESELKEKVLPSTSTARRLLQSVRDVEKDCCKRSALIFTCCDADIQSLHELYGVELSKCLVVPNGVDFESTHFVSLTRRTEAKNRIAIAGQFAAVFLGSWHGPNLDAVRRIIEIAPRLPNVKFLVLGTSGDAFRNHAVPVNVGLIGRVDDETKRQVFEIADVALNPMAAGSGTNLKMLDYMAAGIPVLSTPIGIRGLNLTPGRDVEVAEINDFPASLAKMQKQWDSLHSQVAAARAMVAAKYEWKVIAKTFVSDLASKGESAWRPSYDIAAATAVDVMRAGALSIGKGVL